ncbi:riboflavin transporter MCH5 [Phialemonium atrogriseum]|uniref:Riboflavin transporter MCH5 n=1 Tax=Phialemonium atrogriseum TaxID=1093897 RepID=A0AAJ0C4Y2_9PEZI|nr:riboflavin transporter MCH5 [Phialemonium atrogriseum]KAK1768799.1 riboflavin transporter MCH5 [Phialemonium atrogriseum]
MDERKTSLSRVGGNGSVDQVPQTESTTLEKSIIGPPPFVPAPDALSSSEAVSIAASAAASSHGPQETYPEGGRRAWLVVLGSWLALFSSLGLMNILATFQAYITTHQLAGHDDGTTGWIFSVYTFLCFFLGIYIGPIFDKYGPRWLIFAGTVSLAISLMLLSICSQYWQFLLVFGILCGFATSLLFTPSIAAVGHFFFERRGLATGIASTAGSLGGVVFPLMLPSLFESVGWGWAIRILGFLCLTLTIAANFLIRSRLPPAANASPHPNFRIFKDRTFLLTTVAVFFLEFALFIPLTFISSYAISKGFGEEFSLRLPTILNAGSFVGRILPGWYADKIGPFNANIISIVISIIACFGIWLPAGHTTAGVVIFSLLFGFTSGSNISLIPVSIGRLCKTQDYGRYYATCYTIVSIACLIGIPIGGKILNANDGEYWGLIVTTGVIYCVSLVAFIAAKVAAVGWRPWAKF